MMKLYWHRRQREGERRRRRRRWWWRGRRRKRTTRRKRGLRKTPERPELAESTIGWWVQDQSGSSTNQRRTPATSWLRSDGLAKLNWRCSCASPSDFERCCWMCSCCCIRSRASYPTTISKQIKTTNQKRSGSAAVIEKNTPVFRLKR